jgi:hypothetical protein
MKPATLAGIIGLGLVGLGGFLYYRERKMGGLGRTRYSPGRFAEPPAIDSYTDGDATTILRASNNMPIEERIGSIQKMIEKSVMDPKMRALAMHITRECPERDGKCEAKAIYRAVKKRVRYTGDIAPIKMSSGDVEGIDLYQSARRTWEMGGGDCDDQVALISTLASVIGLTARLRVTAEHPGGEPSHIYAVIGLPKFEPNKFVALDTTLPGSSNFGVEAGAGEKTDYDA